MSRSSLRQAWAEWCAFADGLDLSPDSPDCAALHGRLLRLSGSHAPGAAELLAARDGARAAFGPWLSRPREPAGDLPRLHRAMTDCEPGWRALLGTPPGQATDWDDVERVALTAGLAWPAGPFWAWHLHAEGGRFDLLTALRGRDHDESLALLDALLHILNHPDGGPLVEWARNTPVLLRPAEALRAAGLFHDMIAAGAMRPELLAPLGWQELPGLLLGLCEEITQLLLTRLTEPARPAPERRRRS